jgi:hypothetical protein
MTIIDTTSDTMTSQFVEEDINRPTGKLPDCKLHFVGGPLRVSSSSASRSGSVAVVGYVTFPARQYIPDRHGVPRIQWTVSPC